MQGKKRRQRGRPRVNDPKICTSFSIRGSILDDFSSKCGPLQELSLSGHAEKAIQMYLKTLKNVKNNIPNIENRQV